MIYKTLPPVEAARQIMIYLQGMRNQDPQERESAIYLNPDEVSVVSSISGFDSMLHSGALTLCSTPIGEDPIPSHDRPPVVDIDVDRRKIDHSLESLVDDDNECVFYSA